MAVTKADYEALLSEYSDRRNAIALLKQYRPYLETIPSMRRSDESAIAIPLPVVRLRRDRQARDVNPVAASEREAAILPCDLAILMCDPEWQIKMGVEILVFIHRPDEDFSDLLGRWRKTQLLLDRNYEWLMSPRDRHVLSEGAERVHPLFVLFAETSERIKRGLAGAGLPFVLGEPAEILSPESPLA